MAGRIALMVKGLPSIEMDEAANRFRQYYPEHRDVFHASESFQSGGVKSTHSNTNAVSFTNAQGGYEGGGGLTRQSMGDLRQLQSDFQNYTAQNPAVYVNEPTSASRGKLYKRMGFKGDELQALDARRIATDDLPYTNALDYKVLGSEVSGALGVPKPQAFLKMPDGTVRSLDRFDNKIFKKAFNSPAGALEPPSPVTDYELSTFLDSDIEDMSLDRDRRRQELQSNKLIQAQRQQAIDSRAFKSSPEGIRARIMEQTSQGLVPRYNVNPSY